MEVTILIYSGSMSADQPLSLEFSQSVMGSDELEPCIEDIRVEIDRLRQEEQSLRQRYIYFHRIPSPHSDFSLVDRLNPIILVSVLSLVHHKNFPNNERPNVCILPQLI